MTNNEKQTESFWSELKKTNPLSLIILYLICYVFGTFVIALIVCAIIGSKNNLAFKEAYQIGMNSISEELKTDTTNNIYYEIQSYINLWSYVLMCAITCFIGRDYLKNDAKIFKNFKTFLLVLLMGIIFSAFNALTGELSTYLVGLVSDKTTSANESLIREMISHNNFVPVGLSIILFAPLTEELVYRKSIMELIDKLPAWAQVLISGAVFALPHMLSSTGYNALAFTILTITYLLSGIFLAIIYYIFKKNVYASTIAHMMSNTLSFILLL